MKTFIISDIHSNLEALTVAIEYYNDYPGEKRMVCLGDIVGYGPNPAECMELVLSITDDICMGNHDYAVINTAEECYMNRYACEGVRFSRGKLSEKHKAQIGEFPYSISKGDILYCHSTPVRPEAWDYITGPFDAQEYLMIMECVLCFVGHSHVPGVYSEEALEKKGNIFHLSREVRTIVNVGSIGQPRDNDPRMSFFIFDEEGRTAERVSLEYDIEETIRKIVDADLPPFLGERLMYGY